MSTLFEASLKVLTSMGLGFNKPVPHRAWKLLCMAESNRPTPWGRETWHLIGNALGSSLADAMQPTQGEGQRSSADYRNGSDIESDNADYDRMTQQALQRGGPGLRESATNAEVMAYRMREAGFDGDMVPTGGDMPAGPGLTGRPRPLTFKPL
ncbi:hypothetical protein [Eleftheria terrae]|uniref:hypothetical protein n=1 Tax=Eleftheria terrae TaxID=1597781 RepID=UPI00263AB7C1|nr:hypothetical protein [Eleftheria terrae]WKB55624.1 hypothetical protein N7L95_26485 [Eleftheria terrae]